MPLNTLRLNHAPSSHPNPRIVFIKPLPRHPSDQSSDYQTADTILRAIAAQCLPIMKNHYLSVTTLEEHEPNPEFIGRNFNNGEVIQLVLRGKHGGWLPLNMIQMVMMHELAHNAHMNHGKKFWETRNLFATEMRALWAKGYTGEGFWGGGRVLGQLMGDVVAGSGGGVVRSEELKELPVCGGTFRSRRRKRIRKGKKDGGGGGAGGELTWREKKERRIEKKFGKNGVALGEDEDKRLSLDIQSKGPMGVKPRVAQSKRGRELRAAAALARFETNKFEVASLEGMKKEEDEDGDATESGSDYEDGDVGQQDALDLNGQRLLDGAGRGMIKVCEEDDGGDGINDSNATYIKREMDEINDLDYGFPGLPQLSSEKTESPTKEPLRSKKKPSSLYDIPQYQKSPPATVRQEQPPKPFISQQNKTSTSKTNATASKPSISQVNTTKSPPSQSAQTITNEMSPLPLPLPLPPSTTTSTSSPQPPKSSQPHTPKTIPQTCPICSLIQLPLIGPNSTKSLHSGTTCPACAHVLDKRKDPRSWSCTNQECAGQVSGYINSGDVVICGICGEMKR